AGSRMRKGTGGDSTSGRWAGRGPCRTAQEDEPAAGGKQGEDREREPERQQALAVGEPQLVLARRQLDAELADGGGLDLARPRLDARLPAAVEGDRDGEKRGPGRSVAQADAPARVGEREHLRAPRIDGPGVSAAVAPAVLAARGLVALAPRLVERLGV